MIGPYPPDDAYSCTRPCGRKSQIWQLPHIPFMSCHRRGDPRVGMHAVGTQTPATWGIDQRDLPLNNTRVQFRGTTDVSLPTSFRIDDVSLR